MKAGGMDTKAKMPGTSTELLQTLVKHDAAIEHLGGQMRTLQGEVHSGFQSINHTLVGLNSKFDRFDATPKFDFHKTVKTVVSLATLFALIVAGMIYIINAQNAADQAKQQVLNEALKDKAAKIEGIIDRLGERLDWAATVERRK